ncbi:unnamed protein product, partial [Polarella glacialis]
DMEEPRATALAAATSAEPGSLRSEAPLGFPRQGEGPVTEIPCLAGHSLAEVGIKLFGLVQSGHNLPSELQQALSDLWRPSTGSLFPTTREASSTALGEAPASLLPIPAEVPEIESSTDRTKVTACGVFGWHDSKLLSGLFGIQKGEQTSSGIEILRFIMNLIPFNGICSDNIKGDIATLPMFSQWTPLELLVEDVFLLSSEDLKCMFYLFGLDDVWLKFQAFNRLSRMSLHLGFLEWASLAQRALLSICTATCCLRTSLKEPDRAFPSGTAGFWKVYLDNWDELRVTSRASARLLEGKPSPENLDIHASYLFNEAPRHPKKALHHAIKGLTQGALLDGEEGSARPKPEKEAKYIAVIAHSLRQGFVNLRQLQLLMGVFLVPLARMDFRRPYCHVVTASDASEFGGGVTASRGLTPWGAKAALSPTNLTTDFQTDCSILGVGCFDGISALQVALDIFWAPIAGFVSIENNMEAIRVIRANYPSTQHFSDIRSFGEAQVRQLALSFPRVQLVLIGAGPPCQGVSALNAGRLGAVEDPRSSLQSRVAWLRNLFIQEFPWAKVQVLEESVASMAAAFTPIELCIPFGDQRDFLSPGWQKVEVNRPFPTFATSIPKENPGLQPAGLQSCDTDAIKRWEMDRFRFPPYTNNRAHLIINKAGVLRQPNVEEREIMLGFPRGYTQACLPKGVRSSRPRLWEDTRLSLLGNSWSVPVVSWLLKNLLVAERLIAEISLQTLVARFNPRELCGSLHQLLDRPPLGSLPPNLPGSNEALELALVRNISKSSSSKGSDVKMTSGGTEGPDVWPRKAIPSKLWRWRTICSWRFKHLHGPEHINVLELRAFLTSLRWRLRKKGGIAKRFFHLLDSQVNLGILAKGRTSSRKLSPVLRQISALLLAANMLPICAYLNTHDNPADKPSRRLVKNKWVKSH